MPTQQEEVYFKVFKAAGMQAVKRGMSKGQLPDDVALFLGRQLSVAVDMVKGAPNLTLGKASVLLLQKQLAIANLALGKRADCAIAVLLFSTSLVKAGCFTTLTGGGHAVFVAVELLSELYSVDKTCGISEAVAQKVEETTVPAAMWLDQGVREMLSRGGY